MKKIISFGSLSLLLFSFLLFPSFAKTPQEAKDALAQMKITYSVDDFIYCAEQGKTEAVKLFLDAGMNPNAKDKDSWTALMSAALMGHSDIVKDLIAKGADINAKDLWDSTALMNATQNGHTDIVKALLDKGVEVNAK